MLCSASATIDARDNDGQTPLHYAVLCEREAAARELLAAGADAHAVAADGSTPADMAPATWTFLPTQ